MGSASACACQDPQVISSSSQGVCVCVTHCCRVYYPYAHFTFQFLEGGEGLFRKSPFGISLASSYNWRPCSPPPPPRPPLPARGEWPQGVENVAGNTKAPHVANLFSQPRVTSPGANKKLPPELTGSCLNRLNLEIAGRSV